jgi:hypothetical protein
MDVGRHIQVSIWRRLRAPPEEAAFKTLSTSPAQLQRAKFKALAEEWEPARSRSFVIYPERELIRPRN